MPLALENPNIHHNKIPVILFGLIQGFYVRSFDQPASIINIFNRMVNTGTWYDFEMGKSSQDQTYAQIAQDFQLTEADVQAAVERLVTTYSISTEFVQLIEALRPGRRIYAMLNMPVSIWNAIVLRYPGVSKVFDRIFLAGEVGHRMPQLSFFHHVVRETGANPESTIFVGDLFENLVVAHTLGFSTIRYDNFSDLQRSLHNHCGDTITRANDYLVKYAKEHRTYTSINDGRVINENFTQLMLLEATNNPSLVRLPVYEAEWNFFDGPGQLTPKRLPDDLDTTSMAWTVLPNSVDQSIKNRVMDRMLNEFLDDEGVPLSYFDKNRPRRDHGVCANVVTLFFANGRGQQLEKALSFLQSLLETGAYTEGSRYYRAPEIFLYFMLRLLERAPSLDHRIGDPLRKRCRERIGYFEGNNPVALAMRLHCCNRLDIDAQIDFERLLDMQQLDGSWDGGQIFYYGMMDVSMSNRGLTTAIAQRAIREYLIKFRSTT